MKKKYIYQHSKILVLGCGTQGLAFVRSLAKEGYYVYLLYGDKNNYADSSRYVKKKFYCQYSVSSKEYLNELLDVIKSEQIDTIIPMGDVLAEMMSINKTELQNHVKFLMPDYDVFKQAYDKNSLMTICQQNNYPHPFTITNIVDIKDIREEQLTFPLLIKPNITCGARGMTLVNNYQELILEYPKVRNEYGECHLQKYVKQGGAQVEVQLFINEKQELVNSSVIYKYRWYPEKGGSSCCAISTKNDKIVTTLYNLLKKIGWVGFADFDTIEDPDTGELLIMELNPRVPACVKTAIVSGINWGQIIVNGYLGRPQQKYEYKTGECLRHLGLEVLWFMKSKNRFKSKPNIFRFFGAHVHYQDMSDWTDPMPFLCGTLRNFMNVLKGKEKQKNKH